MSDALVLSRPARNLFRGLLSTCVASLPRLIDEGLINFVSARGSCRGQHEAPSQSTPTICCSVFQNTMLSTTEMLRLHEAKRQYFTEQVPPMLLDQT
jgi:hypothetical protein